MSLSLRVSEIFYSLQGEGRRAGEPSVFVRLQGCSAKHACYASGVRCDTEFESGKESAVLDLAERMRAVGGRCRWVVWTGGEPTDQLTLEHLRLFRELGWRQALETSGIRAPSTEFLRELDWVTLSPKVAEHVLEKTWKGEVDPFHHVHVHELRYVRHAGQEIPSPALRAWYYYLSPHSDGLELNAANVAHCVRLCLENPEDRAVGDWANGWRLSVQQHKTWRVL